MVIVKRGSQSIGLRATEGSRNDLFDTVWPRGEVSDDTLTKGIAELRKAFGEV